MKEQQHLVIAGLGNPGRKYESTRHNMGFLVVKALARRLGWHFHDAKAFKAKICKGRVNPHLTMHLLLPQTYMNESGLAVKTYLNYVKLAADDLIVVVDDLALPYGSLRYRSQGSAGGHNGLKSIESRLGTSSYGRLRIGIDHPDSLESQKTVVGHVLGEFTGEELVRLDTIVEQAAELLMHIANGEKPKEVDVKKISKPPKKGQEKKE